jgi:hypothetical protein
MSRKGISDKLVCDAYFQAREKNVWPYELLEEWTGEPFKVCYRAMERAHKNGLVDYGVSLRSGFLTDKGRELIGELEE